MKLPDNQEIKEHKLPCGLRVVARHCPDWAVECVGMAIDAGSRDDPRGREGVAHFVEHTIFKGTQTHRASYILNRMEQVGGELNAYTTKEMTMVYAMSPAGNLRRGAGLIAELITESVFPADELDKERDVVADEIDSYLDMPADAVVDDFEEQIFSGDASLAHNILGTKESLARLDSHACREFLETRYTPGRMVFFYSGPSEPGKVFAFAERLFDGFDREDVYNREPFDGKTGTPRTVNLDKKLHQAHTLQGVLIPGMYDDRRMPLSLLTNVLGGPGMNSLLNVAMRERRGLVYSVDANMGVLTDVGVLSVYFGCDRDDVKRCKDLARRIIDKIYCNSLTPRQLAAAKRQYAGQLVLGSQSVENSTLAMARSALYFGTPWTTRQTVDHVLSITGEQVAAAAEFLNPESFSTLTFL